MINSLKHVLFCIVVLLLNGCATTAYDTKVNSARSQGLFLDTVHDGKDVVMYTSIFITETNKLKNLNTSAEIKASQICQGSNFKLINIHSTLPNFVARSGMSTAAAISANIQCEAKENILITTQSNTNISQKLNISDVYKDQFSNSNDNDRGASETQTSIAPPNPTKLTNTEKRIALVIGNQAYNVRPLLNPRNDADDVSRALKNSGFEVIDVRDATLSQMRNAVRQFGDMLLTRDVGLVYYAGHGIEVKGRNYFIPVNADIKRSDEIADQSLDVNLILEKMETAKKGVNILIVDACRDDPFGRSFRSSSKGLANMDAPQGTIIAFATSPGKVAADGTGRNSPYTKNLVRAMQIPNLPIEQVFKQVRRAVQTETKNQQTPWENTSLSGDFYFRTNK